MGMKYLFNLLIRISTMSTDKLCVVEVIIGNTVGYCAVAVITEVTVFETASVSHLET